MERIAARGHVNWLLVHLAGEAGTAFVAGAVVKDGDAEVGRITSAALLPEHDRRVVALARVRATAAEPGRRLVVLDGERATPVEVGSIPVES
jgi:glycine cleavage system aminomethyltransferase T